MNAGFIGSRGHFSHHTTRTPANDFNFPKSSHNGITYSNLNFSHRVCRHWGQIQRCLALDQAWELQRFLVCTSEERVRERRFFWHRHCEVDLQGWHCARGQAGGAFCKYPKIIYQLFAAVTVCWPEGDTLADDIKSEIVYQPLHHLLGHFCSASTQLFFCREHCALLPNYNWKRWRTHICTVVREFL